MFARLMNPEIEKAVEAGKITNAAGVALEKLQPGTYVLHKSWGFGRIDSINFLINQMLIDFKGRNSLRYGPVRDPIKSLVECGVGDDIDTVIVDGRVCMENGIIPGVDVHRLATDAQAAGEAIWETLHEWDSRGRTAQEASPWSFPVSANV